MQHLVVGPDQADNEKLGKLLQHYRLEMNLSRAQAANRMGFTSEYLRLIERGKRTPPLGRVRNILNAYNVGFTMQLAENEEWLIVNNTTINFTSRIREARHHNQELEIVDVAPAVLDRTTAIGEIVELLTQVDNRALYQVRKSLLRSRRNLPV
jgi:transcriptional regulator with XRE-family HTH domain